MLNGFFFETPIDSTFIGHQVAEIFKDRVYDKYLAGKKDLTIFDIGGNIGLAAYYFSQFAKEVHTFEPAQEHYTVLTHQLLFNNLQNVIPHRVAIANKDGEADFFHTVNRTMYSLNPAQGHINEDNPKERVKTMRLDTFFNKYNIEHVDFMKIDVEGSEDDILCGDGFQNIADKVDMVFLELHTWTNRNHNQLKDALKIAGFTVEVIPNDAILWIARKND